MFQIGDFAVCPGHGVGQICGIEKKVLGDVECSFYTLRIKSSGLRLMIPLENAQNTIRHLASEQEIDQLFKFLMGEPSEKELTKKSWGPRFRSYTEKIKSGEIFAVADVFLSLAKIKYSRPLSFSEKKLLSQSRMLLIEEISSAQGYDHQVVSLEIDACLNFSSSQ